MSVTRHVPVELTSFVGRLEELAEVRDLLGKAHLVTLVGPGGVGKTRLAIRAAHQLSRAYPDGVVWVSLESQRDPDSLLAHVAAALGIDASGQPAGGALTAYLSGRQTLLVLDNCEHLVNACATLVNTLLQEAPALRILATSREPLRVPGEHLMQTEPLEVPTPAETAAGSIGRFDAVALLVDRAHAVDRDLPADPANADLAAHLCRRLDGIPLAIELAAARLRVLSLPQLVARLDHRFELLSTGSPTVAPRHQTLRALIEWSYELCSPSERRLWERMSVFDSGADLEAVEAVCADPDSPVFDALVGLVDKSVLVPHEVAGRVRYRMLESIRDYGRDRLAERGETDEVAARHRDYYVSFAQTTEYSCFGPHQRDRFARTAAELPNLRVAHEACLATPETLPGAIDLFSSLFWHWIGDGALNEGISWADRTLSAALTPGPEAIRALIRASWLSIMTQQFDRARTYAVRALDLASGRGDAEASARSAQAIIAFLDGDFEKALSIDRDSLPVKPGSTQPDAEMSVIALLRTSWFLTWTGQPAEALRKTDQAIDICTAHSDEWWRSWLLYLRAAPLADLGRDQEALESLHEALRMAVGFNAYSVAYALEVVAQVAARLGDGTQSAVVLGAVSGIWPSIGSSPLTGDQAKHASAEHRARELLGQAAYASAFDRGRGMNLEEAVSFVLGEPSTSTPAPSPSPALPVAVAASHLSKREIEVAELIARGLSNKEISENLVISPRTAEGHVARLLDKLGFTSRARVAAWVAEQQALGEASSPGAQPSGVLP